MAFRRADPVDLDLSISIVLAGVDDESLGAHEEVAPGVLRPVEDGRGDPFDQVRGRLEFGDEHDDLVAVFHLGPRVDPDRIHRLAIADQCHGRKVDRVHDADLDQVQGVDQIVRDNRAHEPHARESIDHGRPAEVHPLELINLDSFHGRPRTISGRLLKDARAESAA